RPQHRRGPGQRARAAGGTLRRACDVLPVPWRRRPWRMCRDPRTVGSRRMNDITALIAEDEAPQRRALQQQLRVAWPELDVVAVCEDGLAALEAVARHRPRVAFLDIRMPGVSGLDVARQVVAN